jgi:hypothetical protein
MQNISEEIQLVKCRRGWVDCPEIDLRGTGFETMGWIELLQERDPLIQFWRTCDIILASVVVVVVAVVVNISEGFLEGP